VGEIDVRIRKYSNSIFEKIRMRFNKGGEMDVRVRFPKDGELDVPVRIRRIRNYSNFKVL